MFFFFQAEDGIRDYKVTGVQTCALPILVRTAVDEGFKHAMSAIIDSNVSTLLTAFILWLVGTGPVQGFAITLIIGILASFITAVFVVRTFYMIWLDRRPDMATLSV